LILGVDFGRPNCDSDAGMIDYEEISAEDIEPDEQEYKIDQRYKERTEQITGGLPECLESKKGPIDFRAPEVIVSDFKSCLEECLKVWITPGRKKDFEPEMKTTGGEDLALCLGKLICIIPEWSSDRKFFGWNLKKPEPLIAKLRPKTRLYVRKIKQKPPKTPEALKKEYEERKARFEEERKKPKRDNRTYCQECRRECQYDHRHDEFFCTWCGCVQDSLVERRVAVIRNMSKQDLANLVPERQRPDTTVIHYFTHHDFCRQQFQRCLIDIKHLQDQCRKPKARMCGGCSYAIKSSLKEREHGKPGLPDELKYPTLCLDTFAHIPWLPRLGTKSHLELSQRLASLKDQDKLEGIIWGKAPITPPSVIKHRYSADNPWTEPNLIEFLKIVDPYDPCEVWAGTPIGDLLNDSLKAGGEAILNLHLYHHVSMSSLSNPNIASSYEGIDLHAPTRKNLIMFFEIFTHSDHSARKQYDELMSHNVLSTVERFTHKEALLYLNCSLKYDEIWNSVVYAIIGQS
jgi:hypothetical protein